MNTIRKSVYDSVQSAISDNSVGFPIWSSDVNLVSDAIHSLVFKSVSDSIYSVIYSSVYSAVYDSVWDSVCRSVHRATLSGVYISARNSILVSIWNFVYKPIKGIINKLNEKD